MISAPLHCQPIPTLGSMAGRVVETLGELRLPDLKELAILVGVKVRGTSWSVCCPPSGNKADIQDAVCTALHNRDSVAKLGLSTLKDVAELMNVKVPGSSWARCCPPKGCKADIVQALLSPLQVGDESKHDADATYGVTAMNLDGSSSQYLRRNSVPAFVSQFVTADTALAALTELPIRNSAADDIQSALVAAHATDFQIFTHKFRHADRAALVWDAKRWQWDGKQSVESNVGKYVALQLTEVVDKHEGVAATKLLLVGVHLPHKSGKRVAHGLLRKYTEEAASEVDAVCVVGDFNAKPQVVSADILPGFSLAINDTSIATTTGRRSIDNVGVTECGVLAHRVGSLRVFSDTTKANHFPLRSELQRLPL